MTADESRNLFVYNGGLLTGRRIRRILELSGWQVRLGLPGPDDWVGVWGQSPTAPRGEAVARHQGANVLRVEDAFIRSVLPGRSGTPPVGLTLDRRGLHFDPAAPSDLERLLMDNPLDDTALLDAARAGIEKMTYWQVSKYNDFDPDGPLPEAPYVLVIDQTRGDASVTASGADAATFRDMLVRAQTDFPGARIVIKTHPETAAGYRRGYFGPEDATGRVSLMADRVSPYALLQGAMAVYTVSSQFGFDAIFSGHRPKVFGQPFYAGWGLTEDAEPMPRRDRSLTRAQLFAGAMILYPKWYDPFRDRLCTVHETIDAIAAAARAMREDRQGYHATGIRPWKRPHMRAFFGTPGGIRFHRNAAAADRVAARSGGARMVWGRPDGAGGDVWHVEDGLIRSRGLGARLVPPISLVSDRVGIYYDPSSPSRLEDLVNRSPQLPAAELRRAENLIEFIRANHLTKYNLPGAPLPELPEGHRILVAGQVEDDASVLLGCDTIRSNLELLKAAREQNPEAVIIYRPHPDVSAGLRRGQVSAEDADRLADLVLDGGDPSAVLDEVQEVWTMTSTLGFEALLRGVKVTCAGTPFYSGWGLTRDIGVSQLRRRARPGLAALVHACLVEYPRYLDPVTGLPCPVEIALERIAGGEVPMRAMNRLLTAIHALRKPA